MKNKDLSVKELRERADATGQLQQPFDKVYSILEREFVNLANTEQACQVAGIHHSTFYKWKNESEEFAYLMERAKNDTNRRAKLNLRQAIENGEVETSKWLIERKEKSEYSLRSEVTGKDGKDITAFQVEIIDGKKD